MAAPQPEFEAELDVFAGFFAATGKRMDDAATGQANALEGSDDVRVATTDMQQRRQLEVHGQFQLGFKQALLAFAVQLFEEVIQPDFAYRTQLPVTVQASQPVAELRQVGGAMVIEVDRVQAKRSEQAFVRLHQIPQPLPILLIHPSTTMRRTPSARL